MRSPSSGGRVRFALTVAALAPGLGACHQALQVREPTPGDNLAVQVHVAAPVEARHMEVRLRVDEEDRTVLLSRDGRWISTFVQDGFHHVDVQILGSQRNIATHVVEKCRGDLPPYQGGLSGPLQGGCGNRETTVEQGLVTQDVLLCDMSARVHVTRDTPVRLRVDVGTDGRCEYSCSAEAQCTFVPM